MSSDTDGRGVEAPPDSQMFAELKALCDSVGLYDVVLWDGAPAPPAICRPELYEWVAGRYGSFRRAVAAMLRREALES